MPTTRPRPRLTRLTRLTAATALAVTTVGLPALTTPASASTAGSEPSTISLPNGWFGEDIANGRGSTFFAGSISTGGIYRGDYDTGKGKVLVTSAPGLTAGLFTELRSGGADRLWASGGPSGQARVYDPGTGRLLATYQLADPTAGAFVSDVVVTRTAVYYTDSFLPRLYVLPLGPHGELPKGSAVRTVPLTGDVAYTDTPLNFNLNGIAVVDGVIVSAQTNTGKLFRVDPVTGATQEIPITDAAGAPATVFQADGLVARGRTLFIARNFANRISTVRLSAGTRTARLIADRSDPRLDIPSSVEEHDGDLWALNARFTTPPAPGTTYTVVRL